MLSKLSAITLIFSVITRGPNLLRIEPIRVFFMEYIKQRFWPRNQKTDDRIFFWRFRLSNSQNTNHHNISENFINISLEDQSYIGIVFKNRKKQPILKKRKINTWYEKKSTFIERRCIELGSENWNSAFQRQWTPNLITFQAIHL